MDNELVSPVQEIMDLLGLNRLSLAELSGLSVTTVEYTEKGIFGKIPAEILNMFQMHDADLVNKYAKYQIRKRFLWESLGNPTTLPEGFPELSDVMHPHVEWRDIACGMPLNAYCEALCIPRFVLQKFEAGKQRKFPEIMTVALTMACGSQLVQDLTAVCNEWRPYSVGRQ